MRIDLIVRGFCTLRPGVAGLSDNIRVSSIIGRFLEHSRIFYFRNAAATRPDGEFYIGSGDWMYRNLLARVEATCPIEQRPLKRAGLAYPTGAAQRSSPGVGHAGDGSYVQRVPADPAQLGCQQIFMNEAPPAADRCCMFISRKQAVTSVIAKIPNPLPAAPALLFIPRMKPA